MAIFQKSVVENFLSKLEESVIDSAYSRFKEVYSNIEAIKKLKEEQYQEGFIRDIFVYVLGYTLQPSSNYNIELEKKNETDSKKADGAILKDGNVIGVIELKDNKTKNLDKVKDQAFGYKNNHKGCRYVISSNFRKLRFYIDDATEYEEFDLYYLDRNGFARLFLYLSKEELLDKNTADKLKVKTKFHEEDISKKLYKDYSTFKHKFFNNIVKKNPQYDKLVLFKKSQKFLDRILFLLFAEDKKLIPENAISLIVDSWDSADDLHYKPLYDLFKIFFTRLNEGHTSKKTGYVIPAYNGGLFKKDEVLDNISVDDEVLRDDLLILSKYDFNTEVDVNILGHIFEHSLSELEEIEAEIKGEIADKQNSKRKKDGVFYTPKYITKYIVEDTIGKLCNEKKEELNIEDFDVSEYQNRNGKVNAKGTVLFNVLQDYKKWLFELKILDPACGSGAFLNQALTYLIEEHKFVDDLIAELTNTPLRLFDTDKSILENNIFGVDINNESVEIAKLSLWLRTAQKGRKLSNLSDNIKSGNSLISDVEVAGNKAFNWQKEFSDVFANGGFDVVIGNPPYLRVQGLRENFKKETEFYEKYFQSSTGRFDIYVLFMEKSFQLIKDVGVVSFILPHKFLVSDFGEGIRKFLADKRGVYSLIHFESEMVFADASTYTCIINLMHKNSDLKFKKINPAKIFDNFIFDVADYNSLSDKKWNLQSKSMENLFKKINSQPCKVKDVFENISQGIVSVGDDIFLMKGKIQGDKFIGYSEKIKEKIIIEAQVMKPLLKGEDVKKYSALNNTYYCLYPHCVENGKTVPFEEEYFKKNYPLSYNYMLPFKDELIEKKIRYKTNPKAWYSLHRSREVSLFEQDKIITPEISLGTNMTYDESFMYHNTKCYTLTKRKNIIESYKFWLAILNSKLLWFFLSSTGYVLRGGFFTFKTKYLEPFPLPKLDNIELQEPFIKEVDLIIKNTKEFHNILNSFTNYLQSQFIIEKLSKKLQNWYKLEFVEFIKELNKAIKKTQAEKLSKLQEMDWMEVFDSKKRDALHLKDKIDKTDRKIDQMVYELYDLNQEEIRLIENEIK